MKKTLRLYSRILFVALCVLGAGNTMAQNACIDFHKKQCKKQGTSSYLMSEASRSAMFLKGQTSEFRLTIYQGKDYRITICSEEVLGENIGMAIVDRETGETLYNNKDYNYVRDFEFTVLMTREIKIVISVPDAGGMKPKGGGGDFRAKDASGVGCLGVLIEEMVTPKKGF
ncbi:MAG: hypothetical protein LBU90_01355 [Bacteroidales bacterium]|jgi:hypothetical protein|nr:hypothetical protein [Bacteroidales bacterium]